MTHKELLAKIDPDWDSYIDNSRFRDALRAVVELHKPLGDAKPYDKDFKCWGCHYNPCPTIQAITEQLK